MPEFIIGQEIRSEESSIEVTITPETALPPGKHRFQLIVTDDSGNTSEADTVEVLVIDDKRPTAIIDAPAAVSVGSSFRLSGKRSFDLAPGKIVTFNWLRLT